jgi:sulfide:quinone oxidoreductase
LVIGMGHGMCTCEGAAFEYAFNVEHELRVRGLRALAEVIYLTNEYERGDFGVGGMTFKQNGFLTTSQLWTESLFKERGVTAILGAHVQRVELGKVFYETVQGEEGVVDFDFAMLLPPFRGQDLKAFNHDGQDISADVFAPNGFLKVDADYTPKPYSDWKASDWPSTYVSPHYPNVFGVGIAFAPSHPISRTRTAPNGTVISPAPPRTGMPSGLIGRQVARSIADMIGNGANTPTHTASMAEMGAACVALAGAASCTAPPPR